MKILAISHTPEGVTPQQFAPHLHAESLGVWELMQADILREIYFRKNRQGVVLVLECASEDEARSALATLPLVKDGIITVELIPLIPYDGLSILFGDT